jgi:hypothetical protein
MRYYAVILWALAYSILNATLGFTQACYYPDGTIAVDYAYSSCNSESAVIYSISSATHEGLLALTSRTGATAGFSACCYFGEVFSQTKPCTKYDSKATYL